MIQLFLSVSLLMSTFMYIPLLSAQTVLCPCITKDGGACCCAARNVPCNCAATYAKYGTVPASCPCPKIESTNPVAEISYGELFDKATILEIKEEQISDTEKLTHIKAESEIVHALIDVVLMNNKTLCSSLLELKNTLKDINWQLWQVNDSLRIKEAHKSFDDEFIALARNVQQLNDQRVSIKNTISTLLQARFIETKSHM